MATMAQGFVGQAPSPAPKVYPQAGPEDVDNPLYKQDHFRMYCLKVVPCSKRYCHDWTTCPFAHPAEKARRRDPRMHQYTGVACPEMKKSMVCPRGDQCPYAHNVFEYWLHPSRYRTQLCNDGVNCKRKICFFAHTLEELRVSSVKVMNPDMARDGAFGETGGLDPFVVAQDTGFGLAQPRNGGNASMGAGAGANGTSGAPSFNLQDLQQLTHLHAKLQAASNMGAFNGLASQLLSQQMQNGGSDNTQAAMEAIAQVLGQQAGGQMGSPQQQQQQAQNPELVQLISSMMQNQQQQQQQAAAVAAAAAQAQNQAHNHMATLQLLQQLQQGGMGGAYGAQGGMGADQMGAGYPHSPMHMGMARPGMLHSPAAMMQQQMMQQMAAQGMGMGNGNSMRPHMHHARASPQHMHMQHQGGVRQSPQQPQHVGGGSQMQNSPGPMGNVPPRGMQGNATDADALAQHLAAMRTSPDNGVPQYGQQQQQRGRSSATLQMPIGAPGTMQPRISGGLLAADQLASSPTQSRAALANGDAATSPGQRSLNSRSSSVVGSGVAAAPVPVPHSVSPSAGGLAAPAANSTATAASYLSNSQSPSSTDASDAASHRSDVSDELPGAGAAASMPVGHGKVPGARPVNPVGASF